ncbi:MAG: SCP2 sterol-binding domain-containing protein [Ectothiorhodospiraceae bacterium]|nr:SCP2 sterol-binding domain-containing protein [Chromatiales bacterium]MCP5155019.1 SCP2 sterol-binding domain-containing protein [Ectothiorhodospiraceae bacterium]
MSTPLDLGLAGVARALRAALDLDPELREQLAALGPKRVRVEVRDLRLVVELMLTGATVELRSVPADDDHASADLWVAGDAAALLALVGRLRGAEAPTLGAVRVSGDVALLERVRAIARGARLDWEEPLARALGDAPGRAVAEGLRAVARLGALASGSLRRGFTEYVRHESDLVPSRPALERLREDVETLRDDVERLEQRIARLGAGADRRG